MSRQSGKPQLVDIPPVEGFVAPGFHAVREEFQRNFVERGELGAACAIYHRGVKVVDLWGGFRCARTRQPWNQETLVLVFSVTKGMAAAAMTLALNRGLFDLDERLAEYWPEFARGNKRNITVRQLFAHQAGLVAIDRRLDAELMADHDQMAEILARQTPAWNPGSRHGYHTLTLGWYQNELLRRVDPHGRSLGKFFDDEISQPLEAKFFIGLPKSIPEQQLAVVEGFPRMAILSRLGSLPPKMVLSAMWPQSLAARSIKCLGLSNPAKIGDREFRHVEIPSANGIGQARGLARIYGVLASGGKELDLSVQTMHELTVTPSVPGTGAEDAILKMDTRYSMGFSRPSRDMPFGASGRAFGCPGAGGSFAMGDPDEELGFAYVTNRMGFRLFDDPREKAVRDTCYRSLAAMRNRQ